MNKHIIEIGRILREEADLFDRICSLEKSKTDAILVHNGAIIEKISLEEEAVLRQISDLETERTRHVEAYRSIVFPRDEMLTLADLAEHEDGITSEHMLVLGRELKDVMVRLARIQETNRVLINDNMEYYNMLLSGLRKNNPSGAGYGKDGREEEGVKNSILFNKTA